MSVPGATATSPWAPGRRRAVALRERQPFAAQVLGLYLALLDVWEEAWREACERRPAPAALADWAADRVVPRVVEATDRAGPELLAGATRELLEEGATARPLAAWLAGEELDPVERYLARAALRGPLRAVDPAAARETGLATTVVTFDPHPRTALGNRVELLTTLERRLELLADAGVEDALVVEFDLELARLEPDVFAESYLRATGVDTVVAGSEFRFGHKRSGDLELLKRLGFDVRPVPLVEGISSSAVRGFLRAGEIVRMGRPSGLIGSTTAEIRYRRDGARRPGARATARAGRRRRRW